MTTYQMTDGTRIKKSVLDRKVTAAKIKYIQQCGEEGILNMCMALGHNVFDEPVDNSHIISVDRCQKLGKSELAYDINNLQRESRSQHMITDGGTIEQKMRQKNFGVKLAYIKEHDPQRYSVLTIAIESVNK